MEVVILFVDNLCSWDWYNIVYLIFKNFILFDSKNKFLL